MIISWRRAVWTKAVDSLLIFSRVQRLRSLLVLRRRGVDPAEVVDGGGPPSIRAEGTGKVCVVCIVGSPGGRCGLGLELGGGAALGVALGFMAFRAGRERTAAVYLVW